jgi:general secretion pathway protein D
MRLNVWSALLALLIPCPVLATPIVSIEPSSTTIAVGTTFSVNVNITGAIDLYAFEFDIGFNQNALVANATSEGAFLSGEGATFFIPGTIDNAAGLISFTANSLLSAVPGANGDGTLAIVSFTALAPSDTTLNLFNIVLLDSQLSGIANSSSIGSVTVTGTGEVPEPSMITLIGVGLACARRTRRSKNLTSSDNRGSRYPTGLLGAAWHRWRMPKRAAPHSNPHHASSRGRFRGGIMNIASCLVFPRSLRGLWRYASRGFLLAAVISVPAPAAAQECSGQLSIWIVVEDRSTGLVIVNGVDPRQPTQTPFTWHWGDGTVTDGWFPQSHIYQRTNRSHLLTVIAHEDDGITDCANLVVFERAGGIQSSICAGEPVPFGYVITATSTNFARCGVIFDNVWHIERAKAAGSDVCSFSPVPEGYVIIGTRTQFGSCLSPQFTAGGSVFNGIYQIRQARRTERVCSFSPIPAGYTIIGTETDVLTTCQMTSVLPPGPTFNNNLLIVRDRDALDVEGELSAIYKRRWTDRLYDFMQSFTTPAKQRDFERAADVALADRGIPLTKVVATSCSVAADAFRTVRAC